ncbi:MAG: hypothetical protein AAGA92_13015 [Planctomycetota bacterium]
MTAADAPLPDWSTVQVTGVDRATFLQSFCTNDVKTLAAGESREAFFTDLKGKIVAHAFVLAEAERSLLVLPGQPAEPLLTHLDRYIVREDVTLADASADSRWQAVLGSDAVLEGCVAPGAFGEGSAVTAGAGQGGGVTPDELHAARVRAGFPLFGVDFGPDSLPQEVGRDCEAISFTKGCYLGQETVARIDALGHVNRRVTRFRVESGEPPQPGDELTVEDKPVGEVTSVAECKNAPAAGLATIRRGHWEAGTVLEHTSGEVIL